MAGIQKHAKPMSIMILGLLVKKMVHQYTIHTYGYGKIHNNETHNYSPK